MRFIFCSSDFSCTGNSARSIIAEDMLNHWAARLGHDVRACSVGSAPSGRIDLHALDGLGAAGVDAVGVAMPSSFAIGAASTAGR